MKNLWKEIKKTCKDYIVDEKDGHHSVKQGIDLAVLNNVLECLPKEKKHSRTCNINKFPSNVFLYFCTCDAGQWNACLKETKKRMKCGILGKILRTRDLC